MSEMFANALGYEELMGRWSVRLAPLYTEFSRLRDGGRILDVGCGTGALIKTIADKARTSEIVGIDPAQSFIDYASTRFNDPRIVLKVGDAMQLPFPAAHFEQTLSLLVMMFVPQPERAANEMKRVTRRGGLVVQFEHNPLNPLTRLAVVRCEFDEGVTLLGPRELKRRARAVGLETVETRYVLFFPWDAAPLRQAESLLRRLPFGAQYYVAVRA